MHSTFDDFLKVAFGDFLVGICSDGSAGIDGIGEGHGREEKGIKEGKSTVFVILSETKDPGLQGFLFYWILHYVQNDRMFFWIASLCSQ